MHRVGALGVIRHSLSMFHSLATSPPFAKASGVFRGFQEFSEELLEVAKTHERDERGAFQSVSVLFAFVGLY